MDHYQTQCPRLAALDDYMKARNDGIYNDDCRRIEKERADHRAAHNFAKIINVLMLDIIPASRSRRSVILTR